VNLRDAITVLIPTSPIPSHPSTQVIETTIKSVRSHLPDAEILIMIDGIRPEQQHRKANYEEYKRRLLSLCNDEYHNVLPLIFDEFKHQAEMTRTTLDLVKTPLLLFMEHDTFFTDGEIAWEGIAKTVLSGEANMVGFYCMLQKWIHPEHVYLTLENERKYYNDTPFVRTWQWSQRPHVASVEFYRRFLANHFSSASRTMIEDRMYGAVMESRARRGIAGWDEWRLMFYAPLENINRSHTCDGRGADPKFEMVY
jgi:hypothetical protein